MNDKPKKPQKLRARQPRGFADRSADDIRATDKMVAKIREVYERYGFDPIETPMMEYTDCLGKFLPDTDRPNEGVFSVQDDDEQWMSLRYDLTAPLARHVAENINDIQLPYRTYRQGWVFRNEKPGPGRFRQFMQFDADTIGAPGVQADAEMCMMMADTMEALGIARGDYVIRVNNRKVLDGVMEAIGVTDAVQKLTVLRAIDKLDKFGVEGVRQLLGAGRWSDGFEKGDFTKGAELSEGQINCIVKPINDLKTFPESGDLKDFTDCKRVTKIENSSDGKKIAAFLTNKRILGSYRLSLLNEIRTFDRTKLVRDIQKGEILPDYLNNEIDKLLEIATIAESCGRDTLTLMIDPSVVRGLEYYTGPVYEAELLFDVTNEKGEKVQFGSVGGGGRYDGLVKRFTGQDVPATGFSIGVSRLMTALKNLGQLDVSEIIAPVLVTVMDRDTESLGRYQKFTQDLRNAKNEKGEYFIRAEMFQGNPKDIDRQLKYANRRSCTLAVIQGTRERNAEGGPFIIIKDLVEGKRILEATTDREEWRETRPAQVIVREADLVAEVTKMLAAQKAGA